MFFITRPPSRRMLHPVPILRYQSIGPGDPATSTPVELFHSHIRHLRQMNYSSIGVQRFEAILSGREPSAPRQVLITFDGGCRSVFRAAWPILRHYGFGATLFIPAGTIQGGHSRLRDWNYLSWEELGDLLEFGHFEVQSHGYSHSSFHPPVRPDGQSRRDKVGADLEKSRRCLAENLGLPPETITHLAWPQGYCDEELELVAESLGFTHQYIVQRGAVTRQGATGRLPRLGCDHMPLNAFAHHLGWLSHRNGAHVVNLAGAARRWGRCEPAYS